MTQKAPGKAHRIGMTMMQAVRTFDDNDQAREWIESVRWKDGPYCPHCGSFNVQSNIKHPRMTHRCRDCVSRPMFTVRHGTVMQGTKLPYSTWALALYLYMTNIKGVSSMRLHREVDVTQKTAWFLLQRLRKAAETTDLRQTAETGNRPFTGPVEVDETYVGGKRKNMPNAKRQQLTGRGGVGKSIVVGAKDRETNAISAKVIETSDTATLVPFVTETVKGGASVYTDEASAYATLPETLTHRTVNHSQGEYVRKGNIHTNGIESFWSMFKRGYKGIYHKMSPKHLHRYVGEFQHRHNAREGDTLAQMAHCIESMQGKRLTYKALIADNGLDSGARGA